MTEIEDGALIRIAKNQKDALQTAMNILRVQHGNMQSCQADPEYKLLAAEFHIKEAELDSLYASFHHHFL